MRTSAQIETSRRGPVTAQARPIACPSPGRQNQLARFIVLANEDPNLFRECLQDHIRRFRPADNVELGCVEQMVAAHWRLVRAEAVEAATLNRHLGIAEADPALESLASAFTSPTGRGNPLELIHRYQTRLQRSYQHAFNCLVKLRKELPEPEPEPEPDPLPAEAPAPDPVLVPQPAAARPPASEHDLRVYLVPTGALDKAAPAG